MNGMILIATTNKFDDIYNICPELVRPGRLTPIHFGYITKEVLQDISLHFFKHKIDDYIPNQLTIPTSQIIELAIQSKIYADKGFDHFKQNLLTLLK